MKVIGVAMGAVMIGLLAMPMMFSSSERDGLAAEFPSHPDIPPVAMRAYAQGSRLSNDDDPDCGMTWALLAAIGKIESDHGRFAGRTLADDGRATPPIIGLALDGRPGLAAIPDTDGGVWDGDTTWDRAVGPMQFIPGTWRRAGVDADGDGQTDPQDIDDAAGAAGGMLCRASVGSMADLAVLEQVVLTYNNSVSYVADVVAQMQAYLAEASIAVLEGGGPIACPVALPVSFIDSWGFPRSGGRTHKGQDMFAATGTDVIAVDDGLITALGWGGALGGNRIWLQTGDGHAWYYAHLDSFAPNLRPGDVVQRGQVIGAVGRTGNAATTPPHLHIQWRPEGRSGQDVNSYALLDASCVGRNAPLRLS